MNITPWRRGDLRTNAPHAPHAYFPLSQSFPLHPGRLLESLFEDGWTGNQNGMNVSVQLDIEDTEEAVVVRAEVAGIDADDIDIQLHGDTLTLRGEKRVEETSENDRVIYNERHFGSFERTLTLPTTVDAERVSARHENGVLTITLPKVTRDLPKQIAIEQG